MRDLFRAGLDVEDLVTNEFEGLQNFHEAMELLENRRAMKVVFYPNGRPVDYSWSIMPTSKPPSPTRTRS